MTTHAVDCLFCAILQRSPKICKGDNNKGRSHCRLGQIVPTWQINLISFFATVAGWKNAENGSPNGKVQNKRIIIIMLSDKREKAEGQ